jgi:lysophospholipase L1-like esterase
MRAVRPVAALAGCLLAAVTGCSSAAPPGPGHARQGGSPVSYYLSLGDSLARGVQPDAAGASADTPDGYADQLYATLHRQHPGLRLVKLGCPGETAATMISGGICSYPDRSQLANAVEFLHAHQGEVSLITIDIGANDPYSCLTMRSAARLGSCALRSVPQVTANLAKILTSLRQAAAATRIIAMNYYLPALAQWRNGLAGRLLARTSELAAGRYNLLLTKVYQAFGVRVADVSGAFHTSDFGHQVTLPGFGSLPRNVAAICQWTWQCAAPPRGPNQHPNRAGYAVIARTFLTAILRGQCP